jgi:hypothetical protein
MIFTFGQHLTLIANLNLVPHDTVEVLWFSQTVAEDTGDMLAVSIMMKTIKIKTLLEVLLRDASG